jgi:hypothetical protein
LGSEGPAQQITPMCFFHKLRFASVYRGSESLADLEDEGSGEVPGQERREEGTMDTYDRVKKVMTGVLARMDDEQKSFTEVAFGDFRSANVIVWLYKGNAEDATMVEFDTAVQRVLDYLLDDGLENYLLLNEGTATA